MSTTAAGTAPVPVQSEPKVTTPPAPQAPAPKDTFLDLVNSAKSPAELRAAAERLRTLQKPPVNPPIPPQPDESGAGPTPAPKVEKPAEPAAPAEPTAPETPAEPATPSEEPTAAPEEPTTPPASEEDDDTPGDDITPTKAGRNRLPLNEDDEVGRMAAAFKRRNRDWTLEQALEAAKAKLGKNKPAEPAAAPAKPKSNMPETVDEVNAKIAELRAQKRTAATELRIDDVASLDDQIFDLAQHRESLQRQAERQETQQAAAYERQFAESEAKAADLYEFASNPESPGGRRMLEIDQALEDTGDPRFHSPNKPLLIAQMVAAELNIAPKSKKSAAVAPKPAAPAPGTPAPGKPKSQVIPGGDSRTAPAAPAKNEIDTLIAAARTPAEVLALHKRLGISQ